MFKQLTRFFKSNPGLVFLLVIFSVIAASSIKPSFYLVGWDNYSSYFNIDTNIFRTLFATWREHRGVGVPSDSESTDLFRLLFFKSLWFLPMQIHDQLYILLSFAMGGIGMYILCKKLFSLYDKSISSERIELAATMASLFYLFNLNTLSTFYFPMIMFINRFALLPLLFYVLLSLFENKKLSIKQYMLFFFILLFVSGSFLVATVFITSMIAFGLFALSQKNVKRAVVLFIFLCGVYAFWIAPFINYTLEKSDIIRLAPTFIEANETQLNKPKSFFSFSKQSLLYPIFFETRFINQETTQSLPFHPLADSVDNPATKIVLFLFPLLFITGSILIIRNALVRKRIQFLWIPSIIFSFLFLSLKEYSILGIFYSLASRTIPLFSVLFRFGDTKFHTFIAFSGSIAAGVAIIYLSVFLSRQFKRQPRLWFIVPIILIIPYIFIFKSYFSSNLIGFFMYNRIPDAYFSIAKTINSEPGEGRVLHLPTSKTGYWKSYAWGTIGSSFYHYFIDKPFMERTFEPASTENAQFNQKLFDLINNYQSVFTFEDKKIRSDEIADFLKLYGVEYIIFDGTVTAEVFPRGIDFWGTFNSANSREVLDSLEKSGRIVRVDEYEILLSSYADKYTNLYPTDSINLDLTDNQSRMIVLYKLPDSRKRISFEDSTEYIDSDFTTLTLSSKSPSSVYLLQDAQINAALYPFKRPDALVTNNDKTITTSIERSVNPNTPYSVSFSNQSNLRQSKMIEAFGSIDRESVKIDLFEIILPNINDQEFKEPIETIQIQRNETDNPNIRLRLEKTILPIPSDLEQTPRSIGSVIVHDTDFEIEILEKYASKNLDPKSFTKTENPNCFFDKLEGYLHEVVTNDSTLSLTSRNGSMCVWQSLDTIIDNNSVYGELIFTSSANTTDLDPSRNLNNGYSSKPTLKKTILSLEKPTLVSFCVKQSGSDSCLNSQDLYQIGSEKTITIPIENLSNIYNPFILIGTKHIGHQEQNISITDLSLDLYSSVSNQTISMPVRSAYSAQLEPLPSDTITLEYPIAKSLYAKSIDLENDGLLLSNNPCEKLNSYRTFRMHKGRLISYFENCDQQMFSEAPFRSDNFYLFMIDYNLASGKYPKLQISDSLSEYKDELASLYLGYPDIYGFHSFQDPEIVSSKSQVLNTLSNLSMHTAYTYLEPKPEFADFKKKKFLLHQDSENEGVIVLDQMSIVELPSSWSNLKIKPANQTLNHYIVPESYTYEKILPSLWRVTIVNNKQFNNEAMKQSTMLLRFNEGYDRQWHVFNSISGLMFGKGIEQSNIKCDGFANCFEIKTNSENSENYIFYTPERLNFLGWGITIVTFILFGWVLSKKNHMSS